MNARTSQGPRRRQGCVGRRGGTTAPDAKLRTTAWRCVAAVFTSCWSSKSYRRDRELPELEKLSRGDDPALLELQKLSPCSSPGSPSTGNETGATSASSSPKELGRGRLQPTPTSLTSSSAAGSFNGTDLILPKTWGIHSGSPPQTSEPILAPTDSTPPPPNRIESNRVNRPAAEEPMEAEACEIARLPEELLSAALARTSPRDACRAAAVSPAFRDAADSDSVWACFLPRDLPPLADGELPPAPSQCKKDLYLRLSDSPLLLPDKLVSMWLDRETGAKCYMLSARELSIIWGDTPQYWSWIPLPDSRFSEVAQLLHVCWFDISGKLPCKMLSQDTVYAAYIVFKVNDDFLGLDYPVQEASISVGETNVTRKVCLQSNDEDEAEAGAVPGHYWPVRPHPPQRTRRRNRRAVRHDENVGLPQKRADGWMELELGEFFNAGGGEDDEVSFSLMETKGGNWKSGLIVQGIEIRRKKSG